MTDGTPLTRSHIDVATWSDVGSRDALGLVASSVAELVGFEIAIISVVRGDQMYSIAVEGTNEAISAMLGVATPMPMVLSELARADDWGRFHFVPHERLESDVEALGWIPDIDVLDAPDAWHPLDLLLAPLYDAEKALIGLLSIDVPMSGLRPGLAQRQLLERYAVQAERALRMAVDRHDLSERIRLAEAARRVIRFATSQDDLESVLDDCRHPLLEGFRADYLTIRTYASDDAPEAGTTTAPVSDMARELIRDAARRCWEEQRTIQVGEGVGDPGTLDPAAFDLITSLVDDMGLGSALLVPLGAGHECLGHIVLGRTNTALHWSTDEQDSALDIARDIGQAVANARNVARGRRLLNELRQAAAYKSQVLATVSHELKNPLSAVAGHVELLEGDPTLTGPARRSVTALDRAARRMSRVVDDLLLLSEVEDPDVVVPNGPMDARPLLDEALELTRVAAERRRLDVRVVAPERAVMVCCDPADLDRVLTNLVSNAVKYTPAGGSVTVCLVERPEEVEIAVSDTGIGISAQDQASLFTEFFRSTNPQAVAQPGTGLGLTICRRIVERHQGRIEVESTLGVGSTFRVVLPAPADPPI